MFFVEPVRAQLVDLGNLAKGGAYGMISNELRS